MKKRLLIPVLMAAGLLAGCQTNYYDYAFGARNRHEAQFYDPSGPTGVDTSIRNPVVPQTGINKDSDAGVKR